MPEAVEAHKRCICYDGELFFRDVPACSSDNADGQIYQDFGAKAFVDIGLTYNVTDNYSVRVGAENVFDEYPDEATYQANRGLIYSRNAPYDTDGGNYYIRLDAKF